MRLSMRTRIGRQPCGIGPVEAGRPNRLFSSGMPVRPHWRLLMRRRSCVSAFRNQTKLSASPGDSTNRVKKKKKLFCARARRKENFHRRRIPTSAGDALALIAWPIGDMPRRSISAASPRARSACRSEHSKKLTLVQTMIKPCGWACTRESGANHAVSGPLKHVGRTAFSAAACLCTRTAGL